MELGLTVSFTFVHALFFFTFSSVFSIFWSVGHYVWGWPSWVGVFLGEHHESHFSYCWEFMDVWEPFEPYRNAWRCSNPALYSPYISHISIKPTSFTTFHYLFSHLFPTHSFSVFPYTWSLMRIAIFIFLSSTHRTHHHIKPPSVHPPLLHPPKDQTFTHGFSFGNGYFQRGQRKHQHQHHGGRHYHRWPQGQHSSGDSSGHLILITILFHSQPIWEPIAPVTTNGSSIFWVLSDCRHYSRLYCVDAWLKLNTSCHAC